MRPSRRRLVAMMSYKYANEICILRSTIKQTKDIKLRKIFLGSS